MHSLLAATWKSILSVWASCWSKIEFLLLTRTFSFFFRHASPHFQSGASGNFCTYLNILFCLFCFIFSIHNTLILKLFCQCSSENTDCIPCKRIKLFLPKNDTKLYLMVSFLFWRSGEYEVLLLCCYTLVHSDPGW